MKSRTARISLSLAMKPVVLKPMVLQLTQCWLPA